jgi:predicted amidophosphoribosyltransferase
MICGECEKEGENLYCPECITFTGTACGECGYCSECEREYKYLSLVDWKAR